MPLAPQWRSAALLAVLTAAAGPVQAQSDTTVSDALVELRIVNGPPANVFPALVCDTVLLLPLERLLELVELRTEESDPGRVWQVSLQPSNVLLEIRTDDRVARRDTLERRLAREDVVWREGAPYLTTPLVAWLLDVRISVDWPELTAVVRHTDHLPVVRRIARERRRDRLLTQRLAIQPRLDISQRSRAVDGAVLDWAATTSTRDPLSTTGLDLGFGMQLAGGSLVARHVERATTAGRYATTEIEWAKAWPDRRWFRQAGVGYVTAAGLDPRGIVGVTLTNTPFARPRYFADELLSGHLPPGWEVEVYQGERLVGFTRVDQHGYAMDVPVRYGDNPLTLVAYGPNGERLASRRSIVVPFDRIPAGTVEYAVSAGLCRTDPCRWMASADARYGVLERLTLRGGGSRICTRYDARPAALVRSGGGISPPEPQLVASLDRGRPRCGRGGLPANPRPRGRRQACRALRRGAVADSRLVQRRSVAIWFHLLASGRTRSSTVHPAESPAHGGQPDAT